MQNVLWLLLLASMWAPSFLFIKIGLGGFPPVTLAATRLTVAAVLMLVVLRVRRVSLPRDGASWFRFAVMGLTANAFPFAMFSIGEMHADSGLAAILNGTTPIFTAVFAHFALKGERLAPRVVSGILLGFAGVLLIFVPRLQATAVGDTAVIGLVMFAAAAASYGVSTVWAKRHLHGYPPFVTPAAQFVTSSAMLLPVAFLFERPLAITPSWEAIGSVLILAVVGTVLAYLVFYRLLVHVTATWISYVTYILPPVGLLLGIVFLGETPGAWAWAGCGTILLGVMVMNGLLRFPLKSTT